MAGNSETPFGDKGNDSFVSGSDERIQAETDIKNEIDKKDVKFFALLGVGAVAIIGAGAVLGVMSSSSPSVTDPVQVSGGEVSQPSEDDFVTVGPTPIASPEPVQNPFFEEGTPQSNAQQELANIVFPSLPDGFLDGSEPATEGYNIGSPTILAYNPEETNAKKTAKYLAENLPEGWLEDFSGSCYDVEGYVSLDPGAGTVSLLTTSEKTEVCSFIIGTEGGKQVAKVIVLSPKGAPLDLPEVSKIPSYESGIVKVNAPDSGVTVFVATPSEKDLEELRNPESSTAAN